MVLQCLPAIHEGDNAKRHYTTGLKINYEMGSQRKLASTNRNRICTPTATTRRIMEALERTTALNISNQRQNSRSSPSSHPLIRTAKAKKAKKKETTTASKCHWWASRPLQRSPQKLQSTRRRRRSNIYTTSKPDRLPKSMYRRQVNDWLVIAKHVSRAINRYSKHLELISHELWSETWWLHGILPLTEQYDQCIITIDEDPSVGPSCHHVPCMICVYIHCYLHTISKGFWHSWWQCLLGVRVEDFPILINCGFFGSNEILVIFPALKQHFRYQNIR